MPPASASRGRSERCAISAAKTSPKSSKIGSATMKVSGAVPLAASACAAASLSAIARRRRAGACGRCRRGSREFPCASGLSCRAWLAATMSTLPLLAPKTRSLVSTDQNAVDIGRLRGAAKQFADRDVVGGRKRLHHVGALRDAFETRPEALEQRIDARALQAAPHRRGAGRAFPRRACRAARPAVRGPDRAGRSSGRTTPRTRPSPWRRPR